tara:strand:- start:1012 stop:1374 length:363 start_codon:yes stop_codon:yes gene_type:complete
MFSKQFDQSSWPLLKDLISERFKEKSRDEWCDIFTGKDVCFAPVLSLEESLNNKHNLERKTFIEVAGIKQPAPAPRFSRTESEVKHPPLNVGSNTEEIIENLNLEKDKTELFNEKIIRLD